MSRRKMFLRMITASLLRRRSRMIVALLSIGIGATILSGLVTIYYDVPRQMGAQFRSYGANMLLVGDGETPLTTETASAALDAIPAENVIGATPYRYVSVQMVKRQQSFVAAGTDFEQVTRTSPYFSVDGRYPENHREVLVGKEVADAIGVKLNSIMELTYKPEETTGGERSEIRPGDRIAGSAEGWGGGLVYVTAELDEEMKIASLTVNADTQTEEIGGQCAEANYTNRFIGRAFPPEEKDADVVSGATLTSRAVLSALQTAVPVSKTAAVQTGNTLNLTVVGILQTGGEEEGYVFLSQSDMAALTGEEGKIDVMELSVSASAEELEGYAEAITGEGSGVLARLVKRVTKSETAVLAKLQALVFLVTVVVLLLTMICVSTTMMAVVTERRKEIGLRKALGASDNGIRAEFLGEGMFLGALGGLLGAALGFGFAQVVSVNVFGSSITFQPLLLPVTVVVSMVIAALSCLLPIKRAVQIDPALVLKGE